MRLLTMLSVFALGVSLPSLSQANEFEVGLSSGGAFTPMESMDALTDSTGHPVFGLNAAMSLPSILSFANIETDVALQWQTGYVEGTSFNRIQSSLSLDSVILSGRLRMPLYPRISAIGSFGLGVTWASLELSDLASDAARPVQGSDRAASSELSAGIEVSMTSSRSKSWLKPVLRFELAYSAMTSLNVDADPKDRGEDAITIPVDSASLGSVNASGAVLRFGLVGRF